MRGSLGCCKCVSVKPLWFTGNLFSEAPMTIWTPTMPFFLSLHWLPWIWLIETLGTPSPNTKTRTRTHTNIIWPHLLQDYDTVNNSNISKQNVTGHEYFQNVCLFLPKWRKHNIDTRLDAEKFTDNRYSRNVIVTENDTSRTDNAATMWTCYVILNFNWRKLHTHKSAKK